MDTSVALCAAENPLELAYLRAVDQMDGVDVDIWASFELLASAEKAAFLESRQKPYAMIPKSEV